MSASPDSSMADLTARCTLSIMSANKAAKLCEHNKRRNVINQSFENFQKIKRRIENVVEIGDYEIEVTLNAPLINEHLYILKDAGYKISSSVMEDKNVRYFISWYPTNRPPPIGGY